MLGLLLKSKSEVKILGVALFEDGLHLRGIARKAGVSPFEAKRELDNLVSLGVLKREQRGNQMLFYTNEKCPFLNDLKQLYLKTDGVIGSLKRSLEDVHGMDYAFIYGSFARGDYSEKSDVDVFVIGDGPEKGLEAAFARAQKKTKREINWIYWKPGEARKKKEGSFFKNAFKKRIWLKGDENGFKQNLRKNWQPRPKRLNNNDKGLTTKWCLTKKQKPR